MKECRGGRLVLRIRGSAGLASAFTATAVGQRQLPAPVTGDDSLQVLDQAIDQLARVRTPYWLGDSAVRLHALASLIAQAQQLLPQAVYDARDQELTWAEIGELLGTTPATAARRYRNKP